MVLCFPHHWKRHLIYLVTLEKSTILWWQVLSLVHLC
jgi:hypothetical protein